MTLVFPARVQGSGNNRFEAYNKYFVRYRELREIYTRTRIALIASWSRISSALNITTSYPHILSKTVERLIK